ncbi:MAG: hypothetical protein CW716_09285 [Candidatus Bathyarchaeum sp.]|nr:MAG: hypothetical protein CW716_09285 [Candidatus Bathyarchaeum sp.]
MLFTLTFVSGLFLCVIGNSAVVQATEISGTISSNTTWTKENSPYQLIDDLTIMHGVTLTIEPDVIVRFSQTKGSTDWVGRPTTITISHDLHVDGNLVAHGSTFFTDSTTIIFSKTSSSSKIENTTFSRHFKISISGCSPAIRNNTFSSATFVITDGSPEVQNNIFSSAKFTLVEGSPLIHSNSFESLEVYDPFISINGGSAVVSNNTINDDASAEVLIYLEGENTAVISDNYFSGQFRFSAVVITSGSPLFERNFVSNHNTEHWPLKAVGFTICGDSNPIIRSNTIANNKVGVNIYDCNGSSSVTLEGNNFEQNSQYNIYLGEEGVYGTTAPNVDAANNWWGTADTSVIIQSIFDHRNNFNVGSVTFNPILDSRNSAAMPNASPNATLPASINLQNSESLLQVSNDSNASSTSSIASQDSTPTIQLPPETQQQLPQEWLIGIIAALTAAVIVLSNAVIYLYKKQRSL